MGNVNVWIQLLFIIAFPILVFAHTPVIYKPATDYVLHALLDPHKIQLEMDVFVSILI
jgi:hypothetical protein